MQRIVEGERALIGAILEQAFTDAVSRDGRSDPRGARRFIDPSNELFSIYCHLLGMEPSYVAKKMWVRIKEHQLVPQKKVSRRKR